MKTILETLPLKEQPAWRVGHGPESCSVLELLAALIGGRRQIEMAQSLLEHFGSLSKLMQATSTEIAVVRGIGTATAIRIQAAMALGRCSLMVDDDISPAINTPEDAAALLMYRMQSLEQECLVVLVLDTRNRLIGEPVEVYHGSVNSTLIRVGELFRPAVRANATSILVAHNHPSGDPTPSSEDIAVTRAIVEAGEMLDIEALDHIVIGHGRFVSLKSRGLGFE